MMARSRLAEPIVIITPVFNDWEALAPLVIELDRVLGDRGLVARMLVVDDGSTVPPEIGGFRSNYTALRCIEVLELRRNIGHQRAIAVGLAYLEDRTDCQTLVVMDSDGEDDPGDVPRLLDRCVEEGNQKVVFAERTRRSESWLFVAFYALYKMAHRFLTGRVVKFGNFSVVPRRSLESLVVVSETWNHYAAAVLKSRQPYCLLPTRRASRLRGQSQMNFPGLVTHGLSALSVDSEVVGVRLLLMSLGMIVALLIALAAAVVIRLATPYAIPGWATSAVGFLLVLLSATVMLVFVFVFVTLGGRQGTSFLPRRDYAHYIRRVYPLNQSFK
jgi:hypothetical protein